VTGVTNLSSELMPKRLEILREAVPRLSKAAVLWCPEFPTNHLELERTKATAKALRFRVESLEYRTPGSWPTVMAALRANRPDALVLLECTALPLDDVGGFTLQQRIPMMGRMGTSPEKGVSSRMALTVK